MERKKKTNIFQCPAFRVVIMWEEFYIHVQREGCIHADSCLRKIKMVLKLMWNVGIILFAGQQSSFF